MILEEKGVTSGFGSENEKIILKLVMK